MPKRVKRLIPVDGWSLAILLWMIAFGVVMRAWRILEFLWGTGTADWSDLQWLPKSIGVDLGFAVVVWLICGAALWPLAYRGRKRRWISRVFAVLVLGMVMFFSVANALSFRLTGSALTLQRLRGDDGATMRDLRNKFAWGDMVPVLMLGALGVVSLAVVLFYAHRFESWPQEKRRRLALVVLVAALASLGTYQLLWNGRDRGYGRHPVGVFVESYIQAYGEKPDIVTSFVAAKATPEGWAEILTPEMPATPPPPPPTRAAESAKNVIVFFSEGVPYKHTSLDPHGPPTTPRLKARADKEGVEMTRFYAPFHKSIQAIFSLFCGMLPTPNGKSISELNPRIDCGELSEMWAAHGVHAGLFHGGYFSFYDKTAFLADRGFEIELDAPALSKVAPKHADGRPYEENSWGIDDRATARALLAWIDTLPREERFAAVFIPITAHYPYKVPSDVRPPFGDKRKIDEFLGAVYFLDVVFEELMTGLEQRQLLDDTLVIFTSDHGESPNEPPRETHVDRAMYEHNVHLPFVMFNRKMFPQREQNARLASTADILPTVLDAMGFEDTREHQGASFLSPTWRERRLFLAASRSNVTQVGFLDGTRKFIFDFGTGRTELYDLATDPYELRDLSRSEEGLVSRNTQVVLTYNKWQYALIRDMPTVGTGANVQERLSQDFAVSVTDATGKRVECSPTPDRPGARRCEGMPDNIFGGIVTARVSGRDRLCMPVRLPPGGGTVDLRTEDRDYFRYVTNLRFAYGPGRKKTEGLTRVALSIDDAPPKVMHLTKKWRGRRFLFGAPQRSLKLTIESKVDISPAPICLFFGDASWRPRKSLLAGDEGVDPPSAPFGEQAGDERADDGHDDLAPGTGDPADPPAAP